MATQTAPLRMRSTDRDFRSTGSFAGVGVPRALPTAINFEALKRAGIVDAKDGDDAMFEALVPEETS